MTRIERLAAFVSHHLKRDPLDLRRIARSPRGAHRAGKLNRCVNTVPATPSIGSSTSVRRTNSHRFSINRSCSISVLTLT
jgi:hypothetical protein